MPRQKPDKREITFQVVEGPEATEEQIETIARILFKWWREDYEKGTLQKTTNEHCL